MIDGSIRLPFGRQKGLTLDEAASTPDGVRSMDGLLAWMEEKGMQDMDFYRILADYLDSLTDQERIQ